MANLHCALRATADFVFVRLHGPDSSRMYSEGDLRWWADRIGEWTSQGRDVYADSTTTSTATLSTTP